MKVNVPCDLE